MCLQSNGWQYTKVLTLKACKYLFWCWKKFVIHKTAAWNNFIPFFGNCAVIFSLYAEALLKSKCCWCIGQTYLKSWKGEFICLAPMMHFQAQQKCQRIYAFKDDCKVVYFCFWCRWQRFLLHQNKFLFG